MKNKKFSLPYLKYQVTKARADGMLPLSVAKAVLALTDESPVEYVKFLKEVTYMALKQKGFYFKFPDFGNFCQVIEDKRKEVNNG